MVWEEMIFKGFLLWLPWRVPRGSVVKCLTRNPGVLGLSCTESSGVFFRGSIFGQDTSKPQPSTGETQERQEQRELSL